MAGGGEGDPRGAPRPVEEELLDQLERALRSADTILAALAADMRDAGAATAGERAERARAALQSATAAAGELQERRRAQPPTADQGRTP